MTEGYTSQKKGKDLSHHIFLIVECFLFVPLLPPPLLSTTAPPPREVQEGCQREIQSNESSASCKTLFCTGRERQEKCCCPLSRQGCRRKKLANAYRPALGLPTPLIFHLKCFHVSLRDFSPVSEKQKMSIFHLLASGVSPLTSVTAFPLQEG